MIDAIRSEWIKLRSVRSTILTFVAAALLVVAVAIIASAKADQRFVQHADVPMSGVQIAQLLFGILGVQIIGQEYRFNTIRTTLTAVPNRSRVLLAKLIVIVLTTAAFSAVSLALSLLVGRLIMGSALQIDSVDRTVVLGTFVFGLGWAAIGFAVGAIIRQPIAGILVLLGWSFVVEGIIAGLIHSTRKWLPFINGTQLMNRTPDSDYLSRGPAALLFFGVTAALAVLGFVLASRRDA